jgi:hypothetical protein
MLAPDEYEIIADQNETLIRRSRELVNICRALKDELVDTLAQTRIRIAATHDMIIRSDELIEALRSPRR